MFAERQSSFMKEIAYARSALKVLDRMPANEARRIRSKIEQYAQDPGGLAVNVITLTGAPYIRLRVGNWRVIMDDRGVVLEVLRSGQIGRASCRERVGQCV